MANDDFNAGEDAECSPDHEDGVRDAEARSERSSGGRMWEDFEFGEHEGDGHDDALPGDDESQPRGKRPLNSEQEKKYRREGEVFRRLAHELSLKVRYMQHHFRFNGLPAEDIFFCLLMRVYYYHLSARRFHYEMKKFQREGFIMKVPSPNTILYHLRDPWLTPLLERVIGVTALPFQHWDTTFAVDSTRVITAIYLVDDDGNVVKRGERKLYKWIKLHFICGLSSLSILAARATRWTSPDVKYLRPLLETAVGLDFNIRAVAADRGYISKENFHFIHSLGAEAQITFKRNNRKSKNGFDPVWDANLERFRMMQRLRLTPEHMRILIEAVNWMIKSRFGRHVRGITETAQFNEALLKVICHNLTRLNQYDVGLDDKYTPAKNS